MHTELELLKHAYQRELAPVLFTETLMFSLSGPPNVLP